VRSTANWAIRSQVWNTDKKITQCLATITAIIGAKKAV